MRLMVAQIASDLEEQILVIKVESYKESKCTSAML